MAVAAIVSSRLQFALVLNDDRRIWIQRWNRQALITHHLRVISHSPARFVETIFDGMTDSGKSFQIS